MEEFDIVVIGSGPGGYVAAIRAAQLGFKTACIEKKDLGGTCLNIGCIPSKALLHSTELLAKMNHQAEENGIEFSDLKVNLTKMMERKSKIVSGFTQGIGFLFKKNKITHIQGEARLKSANTISVGDKEIKAKNIILATGSEPIDLPFLPIDEKKVLTSTGMLSLDHIPKKLLVIGAGVIGVELGSVYNRLGSEVTFIEFMDRICPTMDRAVSSEYQKILEKQGLSFLLSHKVERAEIGESVKLVVNDNKNFEADAVLVAIGRRPCSKNLGLEEIGIETDERGFVKIDGNFQTNVPGVYAIGDLVTGPMLAHKASEEGVVCVERIKGLSSHLEYMAIPNVAYTSPEVASVGLTEERAKELNINFKTASFPFKTNSRAKCVGAEEGFVKILAHESGRLLGTHIIGEHASELIGEAVLAIEKKLLVSDLADTCHAHPTLSEALKEAALNLTKGALHQ